ncbi:MAG: hypothetical protein WC943_02500 [Elusimicrobiota bacterium]|jgi:hypothetical protein
MRRAVLLAAGLAVLAAVGTVAWKLSHHEAPPVPDAPSKKDLAKLRTLSEILLSRNDNDPRLDRDFNDLSPAAKELFRRMYRELPEERRNERGTIVFLLGRNLSSPEDWAFLRSVATEPPCLSMADCSKPGRAAGHGGDEVTLAYPSLVALKSAEGAFVLGSRAAKDEALAVILAAKSSKTPAVTRLARALEAKLAPLAR